MKFIAFYLPQFHPIPENDAWWEPGFTEWTNVVKARPLFPGHYQPHLPAHLGFYDLRSRDTRQAQADLAATHGVHGFCYYHYWFGGKRLLERPFEEVLTSGEPRLPFCLCWANESWSRRWLGEEKNVLMRQVYSIDDDRNHARWLLRAFGDPRYIAVRGRPLFLIYRPSDLPDPHRTADVIRSECLKAGLPEAYVVGVDAHKPGTDFRSVGFDSTLVFDPQLGVLPDFMVDGFRGSKLRRNLRRGVYSGTLKLYPDAVARDLMSRRTRDFGFIPTVYVGWDNTPRRGKNAIVITDSTPAAFGNALRGRVRALQQMPANDGLLFINAWNEWAEGNHLEPDQKYGTQYLEQVREVTRELAGNAAPAGQDVPVLCVER